MEHRCLLLRPSTNETMSTKEAMYLSGRSDCHNSKSSCHPCRPHDMRLHFAQQQQGCPAASEPPLLFFREESSLIVSFRRWVPPMPLACRQATTRKPGISGSRSIRPPAPFPSPVGLPSITPLLRCVCPSVPFGGGMGSNHRLPWSFPSCPRRLAGATGRRKSPARSPRSRNLTSRCRTECPTTARRAGPARLQTSCASGSP